MMTHTITPESSLILILTSLTPLFATPFAPNNFYKVTIEISTFLSYTWHLSNTSALSMQGVLHYACAYYWFLIDMYLSKNTIYFIYFTFLNMFVMSISWTLPWLEQKGIVPYYISHSIWNIVYAAKAIYVAASLNSVMHEELV